MRTCNSGSGLAGLLGPVLLPAGALLAGVLPAPPVAAQAQLSSGKGSIELVASVKSNPVSFLKPQAVFRGTSSDGAERFEATVTGADLIVIRDVRPCLRLAVRVQNAMKPRSPQKIAIRWNGASAAVSVGAGAEESLEPSSADTFAPFRPSAPVIGSQDIEAHGLAINQMPPLSESVVDRRYAEQVKCFNPSSAASGPSQDTYRGIDLRGFADSAQLQLARKWIGEMTPSMLAAVKSVTVSSDGSQTWRGLALGDASRGMLLRPEALSRPGVFFHEGAHLLDAAHGWRDGRDWGVMFMGLTPGSRSFSAGAVGHMDGSAPGEQLAEFVARAREESLGFADARICANENGCAEKLNFLAVRGYISQADAQLLASGKSVLAAPGAASSAATAARSATPPRSPPRFAAEATAVKTEAIVAPPGASSIDIVIDPRFFRPIDIYRHGGQTVSPTWRGCKAEDVMNRLSRKRPSAVISEPPLKGVSRSYGSFDFGIKKNRRHYFALDELKDGSIEMLFDMNANGRLDDDGPARSNMGKFKAGGKGYATLLEFAWADLMDDPLWEGEFKLWFMSNPFEWAIAGFSKSSRTQLIGALELPGQRYDIIIADSAYSDNDGDLSNDGICLRKPGQKAVCYQDAEARKGVIVDGRQYAFKVRHR